MDLQTRAKRVLLFENNPGDTVLIREILDQDNTVPFDLMYCDRLSAGIEHLRLQGFDVVLVDPSLPDGQGLDVVAQVNQHAQLTPVIVITNSNDDVFAKQSIREGAQDYVVKSRVNGKILWRIIDYSIERKKLESALRESQQKYFALVNKAPDPIIYLTADGKIESFNLEAARVTGYTAEEVIGKHFSETHLFTLQSLAKAIQEFNWAGLGQERPLQEYEILRKDKTILIMEANPRIEKKDGKVMGAEIVFRDLTERRKLETELWQAKKMEAVGRLAGGMAHYFNNLLCVIAGYTEFLMSELAEEDPKYREIQEIKKATDRAVELTQQLLSFGSRQPVSLKVVDLNRLVLGMDSMVRRLMGKNIEFVTLLGTDIWMIEVDARQVEQVIVNLMLNSQDAMPQGGKLTLETYNKTLGTPTRSSPSIPPGDYVVLRVTDTGMGMDEETRAHIFEPFFTTKKVEQRIGLGLSTSYGIIKQNGGSVEVFSEVNQGATFQIYFPRALGAPEEHEKKETLKNLPRGKETVLLVEDEDSVRGLAKQILQKQGYKVIDVSNAQEALNILQKPLPSPIHLLLTDIIMPQMSGEELWKQVQPIHPDLKVLFMSGYMETKSLQEEGQKGGHFLQKPFTLSSLAYKIREILDQN